MKTTCKYELLAERVLAFLLLSEVELIRDYQRKSYQSLLVMIGREAAEENVDSNFDILCVKKYLTSQQKQTRLANDRPIALLCSNCMDA
jgi:hypothetical protein